MHSQGKAADLYRYWQIYVIVDYLRKPANPYMLQTCLSSLPTLSISYIAFLGCPN